MDGWRVAHPSGVASVGGDARRIDSIPGPSGGSPGEARRRTRSRMSAWGRAREACPVARVTVHSFRTRPDMSVYTCRKTSSRNLAGCLIHRYSTNYFGRGSAQSRSSHSSRPSALIKMAT